MELHEVILIMAAFGIAGADVFFRLYRAPRRRDAFVGELLNTLSEGRRKNIPEFRPCPVTVSLLKHFENSFVSRTIVRALAESPRGLTQKELEFRFAALTEGSRKPALQASVLRKVIIILMQAGLVTVDRGRLCITSPGTKLNTVLHTRPAPALNHPVPV